MRRGSLRLSGAAASEIWGRSMTALGAYYQCNQNAPVHGLGTDDLPSISFAEQTLREMLTTAPIGGFVPWGEQVSDTAWRDAPRKWLYGITPISDAVIKAVEKAAGGHPLPYAGILFDQPATFNAIDVALYGTPYVRDVSLGVYNVASRQEVPRIRFLVRARHRDTMPGDGAGGGAKSMDAAAANLKGQMVYIAQNSLPANAPVPPVPFEVALQNQLGLQVPPEMVPTPAEKQAQSEEASKQALMLAGVGLAAAVGVAYYLGKRKKRTASSVRYSAGGGI